MIRWGWVFLTICAGLLVAIIIIWQAPAQLLGASSVGGTAGYVPPVILQTIAGFAPTTGSCTQGTTGTTCATEVATMTPASPGFAGAWALVGSNAACTNPVDTADFLIGAATGIITLNSTVAAGTYYPCVRASQNGIPSYYQQVAITVNPSATGNLAPSSATVADDMPNQMFIMAIRIPGQVNTTNCSYSGDSIMAAFNWTFPNDTSVPPRVACELITNRSLSSSDDGTHTGTVTLGSKSETFTLHVNAGTMTASPAKTDQVAHGQYCCGIPGNPPSSFSIGGTYTDGCGNGWGFPSGQALVTDMHSIVCGLHNTEYSAADWHDAATGGYDSTWLSWLQNDLGAAYAAHQWFGVRLNSEWGNGDVGSSGCSEPGGPWYNDVGCSGTGAGPIAPSDWIGAVERVANVIHTNFPGVVVELDSPYVRGAPPTWNSADVPYAPASLAPYIDIWGVDWYYFTQYLPATSPQAYQVTDGIAGNGYGEASQPGQVGFAAAMGTEIAMPEWCDEFSDYNPGYMLTRLAYQMIDYGAAFESYWNSTDAGTTTCPIGNSAGQTAAYNNIFGSWSYSGSFNWGAHTPWVPQ